MELLEILAEIKVCGFYSSRAWDAYLECFEDSNRIRTRLPAASISDELPRRISGRCSAPAERLEPSISPKILLREQWESELRGNNQRFGVISGCFDLLHLGHAKAMEYAKGFLANRGPTALCVLTLSDQQIHARKGRNRPVLNVNERFRLITALRFVDYAMLLDQPDCLAALQQLRPSWYFKTRQDLERDVVRREADLVQSCGGAVELFPDSIAHIASTSELVAKIGRPCRVGQEPSP